MLNTDFDACAEALARGDTVWLLHKETGHVGRARTFEDKPGVRGGYELSSNVVQVTYIAQASTRNEPAHMQRSAPSVTTRYSSIRHVMKPIESEYEGWTTDTSDFDTLGNYNFTAETHRG